MRQLILPLVLLLITLPAAAQLHTIVATEYFWDADPGQGSATPLAITSDDTVTFYGDLISTSGLAIGPHNLNVRVQRDDGAWGEPTVRSVYIGIGNDIEAAEVFFDSDPGEGGGTPVSVSGSGVVNETAFSVPALTRGLHKINLRTYSGGTWSTPVANVVRIGSALIDGAEVFFDTDPGEGNGLPVTVTTPGADVSVYETALDVNASGTGFHTAHMRFRGGGVWSFTKSSTMRINDPIPGDINKIVAGEFFIGVDPGEGNGCPLFAEDGDFDSANEAMRRYILGESLGAGEHVVHVRAQDASGRWTISVNDTVNVDTAYAVIVPEVNVGITDVRITWDKYPEATEYRVHYDTVADGPFTDFVTVNAPDTSVVLATDEDREYFKVIALQPAAQPCPAEAPAARENQRTEKLTYKRGNQQ